MDEQRVDAAEVLARTSGDQIALLMGGLRAGSKAAAGQLVAIFYPELRRIAKLRMQTERTPHIWQPNVRFGACGFTE